MQGRMERPPGRSNTASLLDDLARLLPADSGQEGLQRVLARSHLKARPAPSSEASYQQQCCSSKTTALLGGLLSEAGGTPLPPGAEHSIDQQPGGRYFRMLQACLLAYVAQRFGKAARRKPPPPPALSTPPCNYLAAVGRSVAALHGSTQAALPVSSPTADGPATGGGLAAPAAAYTAAAEVWRALQEEREVAAELTPCPADPGASRLQLRVLAPARTQAAIAAKLGPPAARRQVRLRRRLQGGEVHHAVCAALRYSERAALQAPLLAAQHSSPKPNALVALSRVLRDGHSLAAEVAAQRAAAEQRRAALGAAVLAQHKEMKKAWREKRKREAAERMEALKASDMTEYMRLMAGKRHGKIDELLSQTDGCLRQLAARLRSAGVGTGLLAAAAAGGSPTLSSSPQVPSAPGSSASGAGAESGGIAAMEQSHEVWNQLATAIQAGGVQQPELLTGGELREYQLKGLQWMVGLQRHGLNGILADEMGLGKTIQVIALACHLVCEAQAAGGRQPRPFLIAVPASVLPNWESELALWAPALKVVSYRGDAEAREEVWTRQLRSGRGGGAGGGTHVVLTTYDFLMNKHDKPRLARVHWGYLVVDEGHRLKNAGCKLNAELKGYRTDHRLLLTGTPLQNNLSELWSLLNFLLPDLFSSGEDFQAWFGGAERRGAACGGPAADGDSSDDEGAAELEARMLSEEEALIVTNRLHQVLRPFMLRRLKAAVASELPQKREHVLRVAPSAYQQGLFRLMQRDLQGSSGLKGVNNVLMEMRNICNHPLISRMHPEGAELSLPAHPLPAEVRLCSKLELLDRCLVKLRAGGHKVLLFCTMTRALDVVEDYLAWRGFPALRLDGSTGAADRGDLVRRFNDPDGGAFVFLLSIRAGGVGLNLQAADTVIMYDTDWNPQMDLQAQARAHRMGQTKEVLVLRFVTAGTVEERVMGVSADKAALADRSITGGFFDGKTSADERQRYLLETIRTSTQRGTNTTTTSSSDGQLSDGQLSEMLARGEGELELFEAEDARMQTGEEVAWRVSLGPAAAAVAAAGTRYSRLASEADVAPLVAQAQQLLQPKKDPDEGRKLGRGKRTRGAASYLDIGERDFNRLVQEGVEGKAAVPLLAPTGGRRAAAGAAGAAGTVEFDRSVAASAKRRKVTGAGGTRRRGQEQEEQQPSEQPAEPAEVAAAQPTKRGGEMCTTGMLPKRQPKRKQPENTAASPPADEAHEAAAALEAAAVGAAPQLAADLATGLAAPAEEASSPPAAEQPAAHMPAPAATAAEHAAPTAEQPDGKVPPPKRRRRNPRPAAPPAGAVQAAVAEPAQGAVPEPAAQPDTSEVPAAEAAPVASGTAAEQGAAAALAQPMAGADGEAPAALDGEPAAVASLPVKAATSTELEAAAAAAAGPSAQGIAAAIEGPAPKKQRRNPPTVVPVAAAAVDKVAAAEAAAPAPPAAPAASTPPAPLAVEANGMPVTAAAAPASLPAKPRRRNPRPAAAPSAVASPAGAEGDKENSSMQPAAAGKRRWEQAAGKATKGQAEGAQQQEAAAAGSEHKRQRQGGQEEATNT